MPETFTADAAVELAVVERSGFIESRHIGTAIVLAPDGSVSGTWGDASALIFPRSSMKPLQALGAITAGAQVEGAQLALATASHSGTDSHAAVVRGILELAGLGEEDLGCPPAWPGDQATRDDMVRERDQPARVRMNCSGKHATMLLACTVNDWDTATYLEPNHPLQIHIRELIERMTGERMAATAIDGCGAPVYAMSLAGLARAIHRIGGSSETSPFALHRAAGALVRAVRENPWGIAGPGQPDTVLIDRLGVFAKGGAEGVHVMVAPDGTTAALKMLDGNGRATAAVALRLLEKAGALRSSDVADAMSLLPLSVLGGGRDVGIIRPTV